MSSQPPEPEPQWQQPAFRPEENPEAPPPVVVPPAEVVRPTLPPSGLETALATASGLVWPVLILLAIMGYIGWWPAVMIALITNVVAENVRKHLRQRRRALGSQLPDENDRRELR
nr:hypothetical protein [Propionicimonas sp.]